VQTRDMTTSGRDGPRGLAFAFADGRLLVQPGGFDLPRLETLTGATVSAGPLPVGSRDGEPSFAIGLEEAPTGLVAVSLREVLARADPELASLAGRASQLVQWYVGHAFCGRCGSPTELHPTETARVCPACGALYFPRISPAVITLIHREREVLLAHDRRMQKGFYALIAGFVEPGETLEEAVRREIMEEVGVEVTDLRYMGSQAWPFPGQLMVGFYARYAGGEIVVQESELTDARWFPVDALPPPDQRPALYSIAGRLIEGFVAERNGATTTGPAAAGGGG
jgi:NAD+ diphosphatase